MEPNPMSKSLPIVSDQATVPRSAVAFDTMLADHGLELRAERLGTLQVNVGKLCNQACKHCHVDAGPARTEIMTAATVDRVLGAIARCDISTVDITGGAPELNPSFRHLVRESRRLGARVLVRHNLTVLFEEGQNDLPEFFRDNHVEVISSLPYYSKESTDRQRGSGVFEKSVDALRRLNEVGYGSEAGSLVLNLVHNPVGAFLPADQSSLERDFKRELFERFGITFNNLFVITNMPIRRFLDWLRRSGNEERYMRRLVDSFNPAAVDSVMCRSLVSVDWTGRLFDCDFNQMLDLEVVPEAGRTIDDLDVERFSNRAIVTGPHCFGCTAGAGSSCGGAVVAADS